MHQDLALIESGTVVENLRIGRYKTGLGWHINWSRERDRTTTSLESFGLSLDPRAPLASVSEVDRALSRLSARSISWRLVRPREYWSSMSPQRICPGTGLTACSGQSGQRRRAASRFYS